MSYIILVTSILAATALGTAGAAMNPQVPEINACELLLPEEISAVIGLPVEPGTRRDAGMEDNGAYSSACLWVVETGDDEPDDIDAPLNGKSFVILNALQWPLGSGSAHRFLDAFHEASAEGIIPTAPSARTFGDEALWWGDGLAVRKHDVSFGVSVFGPALKANRPGLFEEQLAPHILVRLDERHRTL